MANPSVTNLQKTARPGAKSGRHRRAYPLLTLGLVALVVFIIFQPAAGAPGAPTVFVDPGLVDGSAAEQAVIITAGSSTAAAAAVVAAGGTITSDLWLIDAVGAVVDADSVAAIAATPGVVSIVGNTAVATADSPYDEEGYVSRVRGYQGHARPDRPAENAADAAAGRRFCFR